MKGVKDVPALFQMKGVTRLSSEWQRSHNDKSLRPGSLRTNQTLMRVTVRVVARVRMRVVGNLIS